MRNIRIADSSRPPRPIRIRTAPRRQPWVDWTATIAPFVLIALLVAPLATMSDAGGKQGQSHGPSKTPPGQARSAGGVTGSQDASPSTVATAATNAPEPSAASTSLASPSEPATPVASSIPAPTKSPSLTSTPAPTAIPTSTLAPTPTPATASSGRFLFGTLLTNASYAPAEFAAGVRVVHLELNWAAYEPQDGVFSSSYVTDAKNRLQAMRSAGMRVVLGIGLQYPPAWAFGYPNSRYVNQYGNAAGQLNLTFNPVLRAKAAAFVARVNGDLGLNNFWAVRVGSGALIETLYPSENADGKTTNDYWAYDPNAQAGSPFPGWNPGQTTYAGNPFTTAQVAQWFDWYVGSLVDGVNWQIGTYRGLGFGGYIQVLMPGQGTRPVDYAKAIGGYLDGTGDGNHTMGRAAVWDQVLAKISDRRSVVAYVSSMADGSGWDDTCASTDAGVSPTSSNVYLWSAARWISYNADKYGLAKMGENPGARDTSSYGLTMMQRAAAQMASCGFQGLMWAHDSNLYAGTGGVSLDLYSALISGY